MRFHTHTHTKLCGMFSGSPSFALSHSLHFRQAGMFGCAFRTVRHSLVHTSHVYRWNRSLSIYWRVIALDACLSAHTRERRITLAIMCTSENRSLLSHPSPPSQRFNSASRRLPIELFPRRCRDCIFFT
jgi:hypothetical protein